MLTPDERALLTAFAAAAEPVDWFDVVLTLMPRPRWRREGSRAYRKWCVRRDVLVKTTMLLFKSGFVVEPADGPVDMTVITDAGRTALAQDTEATR